MLLNRRVSVLKKVLIVAKMVNAKKIEESVNSDYDTTSTGSNESEVSVQLSATKSTDTTSIKVAKALKVKTLSKSLRKKFFRHFSTVEEEEEVLNRYSCALVADILLQGSLFVTSNYFAFYSNVFGYVTRILIPILSVEKITKEKTAKILPNAIGISTAESRYVFGSLLSRDSTLDYITKVWEKVKEEAPGMLEPDLEEDIDSNELAEQESEGYEANEEDERDEIDGGIPNDSKSKQPEAKKIDIRTLKTTKTVSYITTRFEKMSRPSLMLIVTTVLLVMLYLTASLLLYRINQVQHRYSRAFHELSYTDSNTLYTDLLRWQEELYAKSDAAVYNFLDSNLVKIAKVRRSLETLSSILVTEAEASVEESIVNASGTAEGVS